MKNTELTAKELRELLSYDPETGVFRWKVNCNNRGVGRVGRVAGSLENRGYIRIRIKNKRYLAHRISWLYLYGRFPKDQLDHVNGIRTDNRISNLREVNRRENMCNKKSHREGRLPGTYYLKTRKKWIAQMRINGKHKCLGYFSSEEAAHHTYLIWKHNLGL